MENPSVFRARRILLFLLWGLLLSACAGNQYLSPKQKEGDRLLLERKADQAIPAYQKAVQEAERTGDKREIAHLKSLLGWAYSESMRLEEGEKEIQEAIQIAEANGFDAALFHARRAAVNSKSMNYPPGLAAAEKALSLTAQKWQSRAKAQDRNQIIDYAIAHHGLPPDVDMIKTVTMAESSLAVLHLLRGDQPKAMEWGERSVRHYESLTSLMKLAQEGDQVEFFRGMGVAAAAASHACRNMGEPSQAEKYKRVGIEAFRKIGVEVRGEDLLSAYAESGGYLSLARVTGGAFRPDPRFSPEFNRAEKLYFEGSYPEAIAAYRGVIEKARAAGNREEAARALSQLGWLLAEMGRYPEAIRFMQESISTGLRGDFTAVTCARLAAIEGRLGNFERGLEDAHKALDIIFKNREKMFSGKDREAVIDAAMKNPGLPPDVILIKAVTSAEGAKTAIYYLKGDFGEAIKEGEKAIAHFQDALKAVSLAPEREQVSYFEGLGFTTLCVGDAYLNSGQIRKGRGCLERSREYFKKARMNFGDVIAEGLIGYSHVLEGDYERGAEYFQRSLQRIESGGLEELKWHIRSVFARSLYTEARRLEPKRQEISTRESADELLRIKGEMLEKGRQKAAVLRSLLGGNSGEKFSALTEALEKTTDPASALNHFRSLIRFLKEVAYQNYLGAIENIESIRSLLETDLNKRLFQANKQSVFEDFIRLSTELYGAEKGWEALERAKARSLMDLLATKEVAFRRGKVLKEERAIRESFGEIQLRAREDEKKGKDEKGGEALARLEREVDRYRDLQLKIKREEPELASLITASYGSYRDLKKMLPADVILLEYFLAPDITYIWVLDRERIAVQESRVGREELKKIIRDFREALTERDREKERSLGRALYGFLIQPVKDQIQGKRVGIIPHQVLHYLPFGALHAGDRYFIEEYPLFQSPSGAVLQYALEKGRGRGEKLLALGNPDLRDPAYDLPFAQIEVEEIARLYPATKIYTRQDASKETFLKECGIHDLVHLACHAEFSDIDPLYSSIRLADGPQGRGRLETHEIFSLEMRPHLVVLSACKTGLGLVTSGDELIGMNRAFIYAGAPSILSSLWSVSDPSTAKLMEGFYRSLKTMPKDEALQKAQVEMIRDGEFSHPFFWAAFYLTGDWR